MSDVETNTVTKICIGCGDEKSITEFHRNKNCKDGYLTKCKKCYNSYYKANKDKIYVYIKENKENISAYKKRYYKENKEKLNSDNKVWRLSNPDKCLALSRNRRARKRSSKGTHTAADIQNLLKLQKSKCAVCCESISKGYHVDHIVALVNGGGNDKYNLQLLCAHCNCSKHTKDPIYFMNENGRLI